MCTHASLTNLCTTVCQPDRFANVLRPSVGAGRAGWMRAKTRGRSTCEHGRQSSSCLLGFSWRPAEATHRTLGPPRSRPRRPRLIRPRPHRRRRPRPANRRPAHQSGPRPCLQLAQHPQPGRRPAARRRLLHRSASCQVRSAPAHRFRGIRLGPAGSWCKATRRPRPSKQLRRRRHARAAPRPCLWCLRSAPGTSSLRGRAEGLDPAR